MSLPFRDRGEAGRELADALRGLDLEHAVAHPLVLAIPRGGLLVAAPIAEALGGDLDVVVVRKVGAPGNPELGIGAVGASGEPLLDERLVDALRVSERHLEKEVGAQQEEAKRRVDAYRGDAPPAHATGRDVIVTDDGIATGGTVMAAGKLLRSQAPKRLVLAVPVAPGESIQRLRDIYDEVVCLHTPEPYFAVGQWFVDFHQVTDDEVKAILRTSGPVR